MRARKPPAPLEPEALYDYAVKLLGQQMRTVAQLKRLLRRRVMPGEAGASQLESVLERLRERRYLDDAGFAQDYTRLRQENSSFGRRRVQQDLIRKGVHADVIAETLDQAYENVSEVELARRHLVKKRVSKPSTDKEAARVMRLLLRAGFSPGIIFRILKEWDVEESELAALESLDTDETAGETE